MEPQTSDRLPAVPQREARKIFLVVFVSAFAVHMTRMSFYLSDGIMWANQIRYFLTRSSLVFDFYSAYGHPGTTLVGMGSLLHVLSGLSYDVSLTLSASLLVAAATAACAALAYLLEPRSLWWFTTAFILTFSRFYITATPPTVVVMPLIALSVLALCWLWTRRADASGRWNFLWGGLLGLSAATRLDVTLFVGAPLVLLYAYRFGRGALAQVIAGGILLFFIADPFLWFMPVQHIADLWHKFNLHYSTIALRRPLPLSEWVQGVPLAVVSIAWFLVQYRQRRLSDAAPAPVLLVLLGMTLLGGMFLASAKFQSIRYLFPMIMIWEIFLPLFALQGTSRSPGEGVSLSGNMDKRTAWVIVGFIIPTQIIGYLFMFID